MADVAVGRKKHKTSLFSTTTTIGLHGPPALPERFFPVGLGEVVRKLAALCEYPGKRARFHAC